mgnify:CR=1 FL=1
MKKKLTSIHYLINIVQRKSNVRQKKILRSRVKFFYTSLRSSKLFVINMVSFGVGFYMGVGALINTFSNQCQSWSGASLKNIRNYKLIDN